MKKFLIQALFLLIIIFGAFYYTFGNSQTNFLNFVNSGTSNSTLPKAKLRVGNIVLDVELADTPQKRNVGLGGRDVLAANSGMLFIFPEVKKYRFWMKNVKFPLDFIFIADKKVVDIIKNVPPPLPNQKDSTLAIYEPVVPIDMMVEVSGGFADIAKIGISDPIAILP